MASDPENTNESPQPRKGLGPLWWLMLLLPAAWIYPRTPLADFIICPFRFFSGYSCPGCGMTRSMTSLAGGDLVASVAFHPGGILLVTAMSIFAGVRLADRLKGRPVLVGLRRRWARIETAIYGLLLLSLLGFWIWRLVGELQG
jgi:hypothetical protein